MEEYVSIQCDYCGFETEYLEEGIPDDLINDGWVENTLDGPGCYVCENCAPFYWEDEKRLTDTHFFNRGHY